MFIGRKKELESLERVYNLDGFGMTVIYGRRRIGKTALISEFLKDKTAIFYTASKVGKDRNLELFTAGAISVLEPSLFGILFENLEAVFDFITSRLGAKKLVIAIDELTYWAERDEALLSVMQKYIDTKWADKELMMILCGSALSFMENKVLSEKSPLFGRRTTQIKLEAFSYKEAALFTPSYTNEEKAVCYGLTGGVAKYLSLFNPEKSLDDNIKKLFFSADGYLYDETRNLLVQEFSDTTLVNNVIEQIANGETTVNVIAQKTGESTPAVLYCLDKLISVGLIEKRKCIMEENNKKKTRYMIKDGMFRFWYRFIPKARSVIEIGRGDNYYDLAVKPMLHDYMSCIFEDMCRSYILEEGTNGKFEIFITRVGQWWGTEPIEDAGEIRSVPADIDVVGISDTDKAAIIAECKFRNEKIGKSVYETLLRRSAIIAKHYPVKKIILFSLGGFSDWINQLNDNIVMKLTLDDLYRS